MKRIFILCAFIAFALTSCDTTKPQQTAPQTDRVWEYMVVKLTDNDPAAETTTINDLGTQGWELVDSYPHIGTTISRNNYGGEHINVHTTATSYIFKRPKALN